MAVGDNFPLIGLGGPASPFVSYEPGAEPAASADTQALQGKGKTRFDKAPLPLFVPQDQFSASFGTKAGSSSG